MAKKKFGIIAGDFVVTAIFAGLILLLVGFLTGLLESIALGSALVLILGAVFLTFSLRMHQGKEDLFTAIPLVLFIMAFYAVLGFFGFEMLSFVIELNALVMIAFGFGSVFFAKVLSTKVLRGVGVRA
jgi:hypothetical protein